MRNVRRERGEGGKERKTYPAHNPRAAAAFGHQVAGAAPALAVAVVPAPVFHHVEPVAGAGAVAEGVLGVDGDVLVLAVQGVRDEGAAVLEQGLADLAARAGQVVERVQVERRRDRHCDTGVSCQPFSPSRPPLQFLSPRLTTCQHHYHSHHYGSGGDGSSRSSSSSSGFGLTGKLVLGGLSAEKQIWFVRMTMPTDNIREPRSLGSG